jgi:hypothetical protein
LSIVRPTYRNADDGFRDAVKRAGLQAPGRLSLHSLRHGFASLLIAEGMNVVFVSRQLGHANPTITLGVYANLFEGRRPRDSREGRAGGELRSNGERTLIRKRPRSSLRSLLVCLQSAYGTQMTKTV